MRCEIFPNQRNLNDIGFVQHFFFALTDVFSSSFNASPAVFSSIIASIKSSLVDLEYNLVRVVNRYGLLFADRGCGDKRRWAVRISSRPESEKQLTAVDLGSNRMAERPRPMTVVGATMASNLMVSGMCTSNRA